MAPSSLHPDPEIVATVRHVAGQLGQVARREREGRELAVARDAALAAARSKSDFLATMSHEIRTPMNGVIGLTELLLGTGLDEQQRRYADGVQTAGGSLLAIIDDILDFSKIEAGKLELETIDYNLVQVIEDVAALVAQEAAGKGLELIAYCAPDVPEVLRGDPSRLRQVLLNLASNAVKFTTRGEVVIRAHLQTRTTDGVVVRFEVAETGIGLSHADRPRLFQPFSQADSTTTRRFGGTGLGLAISQTLVTAMGGVLDVESESGDGSVFWFEVPMGIAEDQTPAPRTRGGLLAEVRVLVVDDSQTNRLILSEQLTAWGMRPDTVADGPVALADLAQAAADGDPYVLAVVDLCMPDMDGLQLARAIRSDPALAATQVVLLTSGPDVSALDLRASGVKTCLAKPVHLSRLHTVLQHLEGEASPEAPEGLPAPSPRPAGRRGHVLVVEDNDVNQLVAVGILEHLGYTAEVAGDGFKALEAMRRSRFTAVLIDCQMPEMDGYAATRAIRNGAEETRRIPIIAMTASATEVDRGRCLAAGMDDFITKPVSTQVVRTTLEKWHEVSQAGSDLQAAHARHAEVLDPARLTQVRGLTPGQTLLHDRIIASFLDSAPRALARIREAIDNRSPEELLKAAHWLGGAALSVGAIRVAAGCADVQHLGLTRDLDPAAGMVALLKLELDLVARALKKVQDETTRQHAAGRAGVREEPPSDRGHP